MIPLKTWWKAKKYFKRPKAYFRIYCHKCDWKKYKFFKIKYNDVSWKDKYDSPSFEYNPFLLIVLFSCIIIRIDWLVKYDDEFGEKQDGSFVYWEYLLDWLKYSHTLTCYSTWTSTSELYGNNDTKYIIPCVVMSLNKNGIKQLKKELENERLNNTK